MLRTPQSASSKVFTAVRTTHIPVTLPHQVYGSRRFGTVHCLHQEFLNVHAMSYNWFLSLCLSTTLCRHFRCPLRVPHLPHVPQGPHVPHAQRSASFRSFLQSADSAFLRGGEGKATEIG